MINRVAIRLPAETFDLVLGETQAADHRCGMAPEARAGRLNFTPAGGFDGPPVSRPGVFLGSFDNDQSAKPNAGMTCFNAVESDRSRGSHGHDQGSD